MRSGISAETHQLLQKRLRQALRPLDIVAAGALATCVFATAYACSCFSVRYADKTLASVGILVCIAACAVVTAVAFARFRGRRPCRSLLASAILSWLGLMYGKWFGDKYWQHNMMKYYTWPDMANYVNIDPDTDQGQSYMDAGTVYFREGSYVLEDHAIAFLNGARYCVAPVVRASPNVTVPRQTVNGFVLPRSGTVDFWAVGTDCCGPDGRNYRCGDVKSMIARSGLRILDSTSQSMYLLGVQEWSATTGLPVKHPLFFSWVKDPILHAENLKDACTIDFVTRLTYCLVASSIASVMLHTLLRKFSLS